MENTNYAGFWWRALAHLLDTVVMTLANCIFGLGIGLSLGLALVLAGMDKTTMQIICRIVGALIGIVSQWLYYAMMESSPWQATLGKKVCGLTVTNIEGQRLSFKRATGRYWGKWISSLTCLVGYIMAGFTERKQALHDIIANTLVMREAD